MYSWHLCLSFSVIFYCAHNFCTCIPSAVAAVLHLLQRLCYLQRGGGCGAHLVPQRALPDAHCGAHAQQADGVGRLVPHSPAFQHRARHQLPGAVHGSHP